MRLPFLPFTLLVLIACGPTGGEREGAGDPGSSVAAAPDTGSVAAGAFRLEYRAQGAGPPVMVIGSSRLYPATFSATLRENLRLVFLDHRGFSPPPSHRVDTAAFALDTLLEDVERVRQALDLGRVTVLGHSGNAFLALEYAKRFPEHVSHVVMIGIAPDLSPGHAQARDRHWADSASAERKAAMEERLRELPDDELARRTAEQAYVDRYVRNAPMIWYDAQFDSSPFWEGVNVNLDMVDHVWGRIFRDIDITVGLERVTQPVFLALGRYDFLLAPPSIWDPLRGRFQDLTIHIFERSGHWPQYEEAELFDRRLLEWMNGQRTGG